MRLGACLIAATLGIVAARAQDNYEIQVYPGETVKRGWTMFETHTNFTFQGSKKMVNGMLPTNHQIHETFEITHGFTDWFETGFYVFTAAGSDFGYQWVGNHIRPRVRAPASWNWPLGVSLSTEIGYQRNKFSQDSWTWEIRPIVDKEAGKWYFAFNPTLGRALHGPGVADGLVFSPNFKVGYEVFKKVSAGFEYYGGLGRIGNFDPLQQQEHQFVPSIDVDFGPQWEFNFGVGVGVTKNTDHLLAKVIIGRRFEWSGLFGKKKP